MGSHDDTKFRDEAITVPDGPQTQEVTILFPVTVTVMRTDKSLCAANCRMFSGAKPLTFWCSLFQTFLSVSKGRAARCNGCIQMER